MDKPDVYRRGGFEFERMLGVDRAGMILHHQVRNCNLLAGVEFTAHEGGILSDVAQRFAFSEAKIASDTAEAVAIASGITGSWVPCA